MSKLEAKNTIYNDPSLRIDDIKQFLENRYKLEEL